MYGEKAFALFDRLKQDGIIDAEGKISFSLLNINVDISGKDSIGSLLQEWLGTWMDQNGIYHRNNTNPQMPPDYYLGDSDNRDWLEVKSFDFTEPPNFDIANFDAYTRDLKEKAHRLDADYLIMGYLLSHGKVQIKGIWLKKIWEISCPSAKYPIRTQVKQGKIVNIRPYNFKTNSRGFQPFQDRHCFVTGIKDTLAKYNGDPATANEWEETVKRSYHSTTGSSL